MFWMNLMVYALGGFTLIFVCKEWMRIDKKKRVGELIFRMKGEDEDEAWGIDISRVVGRVLKVQKIILTQWHIQNDKRDRSRKSRGDVVGSIP